MRGLSFVVRVNEQIVAAVTACCRTYFNTLNERFNRKVYHDFPHQPSRIDPFDLQHVESLMRQTVLDVLGPSLSGYCSNMQDLHATCFAHYTHPETDIVMCQIPRNKVCAYLIAIASLSHERLGDRTLGVRLSADILRLITQLIDFH